MPAVAAMTGAGTLVALDHGRQDARVPAVGAAERCRSCGRCRIRRPRSDAASRSRCRTRKSRRRKRSARTRLLAASGRGRVDRRREADGCRDRGVGLGSGLCFPAGRDAGAGWRGGRTAGGPRRESSRARPSRVPGELLHRSPLDPATLRKNVTSPAGTTAAALDVLMASDGLDPLMRQAVAARRRAGALAGDLRRLTPERSWKCRLRTPTLGGGR